MAQTINDIQTEAQARMSKSVETLKSDLSKIRTGRAHVGLLDHIKVDYYGSKTPLSQTANISVGDARTLVVTPWDKSLVQAIEKAVRDSDLGLNPVVAGQVIRVPLPPLTEERRRELGKHVRTEGETAKIAIRNVRRDGNNQLKELLKTKLISEDEDKRAEEAVQKMTDRFVAEVDQLIVVKEQEIMQM